MAATAMLDFTGSSNANKVWCTLTFSIHTLNLIQMTQTITEIPSCLGVNGSGLSDLLHYM